MRTILFFCLLACVTGCGSSGPYGPEPTGAWVAANQPQPVTTHKPKASAAQTIVPAIDISQR